MTAAFGLPFMPSGLFFFRLNRRLAYPMDWRGTDVSELKTRLIEIVGTEQSLITMWTTEGGCPGRSRPYHRAEALIAKSFIVNDPAINTGAGMPDASDPRWPTVCQYCGQSCPPEVELTRSMSTGGFYNTESGRPEPGDLYYATWYDCVERGKCIHKWSNCDGKHLFAICPNGQAWDIDSRASNCTMPEDTTHRCWVRHGEPPNIHVDKNGHTCAAGAGSIIAGDYHGFLHHGKFTGC